MRRNIYVMLTVLAVLTTTGIAIEGYGVEGEDYVVGEVIVKFAEAIDYYTEGGICYTGIPEIDALNEEYGVYGMEQVFPEPNESEFNDCEGRWSFDDAETGWQELRYG